jgi:Caenorhabditis protein of unknown function, DUF268
MSINPAELAMGALHSIFLDLLEEFRRFTRIRRNNTVLDQFDQQYFFIRIRPSFAQLKVWRACSMWVKKCPVGGWRNVIEHIGLGRYGDPLDPDGELRAIGELVRVLAPRRGMSWSQRR